MVFTTGRSGWGIYLGGLWYQLLVCSLGLVRYAERILYPLCVCVYARTCVRLCLCLYMCLAVSIQEPSRGRNLGVLISV